MVKRVRSDIASGPVTTGGGGGGGAGGGVGAQAARINAAAENRAAAVDRLRIIIVSVIKVFHSGHSVSQPGLPAQSAIEIRCPPPRRLIHAARQGWIGHRGIPRAMLTRS